MNPIERGRAERQAHLFGAHPLQYREGTPVATTKSPPTWDPAMACDPTYPHLLKSLQLACPAIGAQAPLPEPEQCHLRLGTSQKPTKTKLRSFSREDSEE
eukprot:4750147-Amphidinium_carterae.2